MAALHDDVFDNGLSTIDDSTENLYLLSADPGITWADIATYTLGSKATPSIAIPSDRDGGGREVIVSAITDGSVTATGTATHFALTDDSASKVLVSGAISAAQVVTSGNVFTLTEFTVGIPDPA
jgi:hypothetical protein